MTEEGTWIGTFQAYVFDTSGLFLLEYIVVHYIGRQKDQPATMTTFLGGGGCCGAQSNSNEKPVVAVVKPQDSCKRIDSPGSTVFILETPYYSSELPPSTHVGAALRAQQQESNQAAGTKDTAGITCTHLAAKIEVAMRCAFCILLCVIFAWTATGP